MLRLLLCATSVAAQSPGSAWEFLGPRNIFDDQSNHGQAGTLATAASPAEDPTIIYTGGQNNGASSGVLKSVDMGATWVQASDGLYDTRVQGLFVYPSAPGAEAAGQHVLCGTPTGVWESVDGARSWKLIEQTKAFGQCHSFRRAAIGGKSYVFAATTQGVANVPLDGGTWSLIKSPQGDWHSPLSVTDGPNTVLCGCLQGIVVLGAVTSPTAATFSELRHLHCAIAAVDPNDKQHFLFSNSSGWQVFESTDGGQTAHALAHIPGSFYVAIDRQGWYYTGAEAGAFRSMDKGQSWQPYVVNMTSREGFVDNRVPNDYQRIVLDFAGDNVAFPSDQGLFIKPPGSDPNTSFTNACGNMSNNIAITVAVSEGEGSPDKNYLVMSVWDWAPIASWDSGAHWPATTCNAWNGPGQGVNCAQTVGYIGEGGAAYGFGRSNHMVPSPRHNYHNQNSGLAEIYLRF
jgi:hypothetical protein